MLFYFPLYGTDGETYDDYPILASSMVVSKDKKDYTYNLNPNARWSDGTPVTTDDFEFSFNKLMDPKVEAAPLRGYFEGVKFQKIDRLKFSFHIDQPRFNTLQVLNGFVPLQKKQFENEPDFNKSRENLRPIGTGPFKVTVFSRDQQVVLEHIPDWWAKDLPRFKSRYNQNTWTFKIISDMALGYEKFLKGEIDLVSFTSEQFANQVTKSDREKVGASREEGKSVWGGKLPTDAAMAWSGLALNLNSPIFSSKNTRKGLAYLVDYKAVIERAYFGLISQSVSPFGSNTENTDPGLKAGKGIYTYDPKKAAEYFEKDGWVKKDGLASYVKDIGGKQVTFSFVLKYYASNPASEKMAVILKEVFKKSGVNIDLRPTDGAALSKDFDDKQFDAMIMGWGGGSIYPDPKQLWSSDSISDGSNKVAYSNPQVDALIKKADLEFNRKKRAKLLQEINRILYDDVPYIFMIERHFVIEGINSRFKSPKWIERYSPTVAKELFYE